MPRYHYFAFAVLITINFLACMSPKDEPLKSKPKETGSTPKPPTSLVESAQNNSSGQVVSGREIRQLIDSASADAVLVNVWASWCGPCKREFPMLVKFQQEWRKRGVKLIFVSVDEKKDQQKAKTFAEAHNLADDILFASRPLGPFKQSLNPNWPGMLPASFLYDRNGKLRYFWGGPVYEKELTPIIEGLLAGKKIDGQQLYGLAPGARH